MSSPRNDRLLPLAIAAALIILVAGPASAGEMGRETRRVSGFDRVVLHSIGELVIDQGSSESLTLEAETSLLPKISTEVRGGVLHFSFNQSRVQTQHPLRYRLTVRTLAGVETRGSGDVQIRGVKADRLEIRQGGSGGFTIEGLNAKELIVRTTGSGDVVASGSVVRQDVVLEGAASYDAAALASSVASVIADGSGDATVRVKDRLTARVSGAGDIRYIGRPRVDKSLDGAGEIAPAD